MQNPDSQQTAYTEMKCLFACLTMIVSSLGFADEQYSEGPRTNLSIEEIRNLEPTIRIREIEEKLRYFSRPAVAVPLIFFEIECEIEKNCAMAFDIESGLLLYAWIVEDSTVLWPMSLEGKSLSEIDLKFKADESLNQSAHPTPDSRSTPSGRE